MTLDAIVNIRERERRGGGREQDFQLHQFNSLKNVQ